MTYHIETERLILRELQLADLPAWFAMDSDPAVHTFLGNKPVKKMAEIEQNFQFIQQQYAENGIGRWAAIEKETGEFIGWTGLKLMTEPTNNQINFYDVGYRLAQKHWGKGYATESAKAAIAYGFTELQATEIIGIANVDNVNSRHALEKCGLQFVEKFVFEKWHHQYCDWLKITKEQWILRQQNEHI
ncbi:MAG: GNAT family N-acetyltransferase [Flavobacterium sp. BFFFF2]|nr:MAG: GNAT family N-acetyltransferase [Flavobacterium sp. BFFFF2]